MTRIAMNAFPFSRRAVLGMLGGAAFGARAQASWPSRPIRVIVPYPPGGVSDLVTRAIAERLSAALGQTVIVDN